MHASSIPQRTCLPCHAAAHVASPPPIRQPRGNPAVAATTLPRTASASQGAGAAFSAANKRCANAACCAPSVLAAPPWGPGEQHSALNSLMHMLPASRALRTRRHLGPMHRLASVCWSSSSKNRPAHAKIYVTRGKACWAHQPNRQRHLRSNTRVPWRSGSATALRIQDNPCRVSSQASISGARS